MHKNNELRDFGVVCTQNSKVSGKNSKAARKNLLPWNFYLLLSVCATYVFDVKNIVCHASLTYRCEVLKPRKLTIETDFYNISKCYLKNVVISDARLGIAHYEH